MTPQSDDVPQRLPQPERKLAAIRGVLAANAPAEILDHYDAACERVFAEAEAQRDVEPLHRLVNYWWNIAVQWCDPEAQQAFLAQVERYASGADPLPRGLSSERAA